MSEIQRCEILILGSGEAGRYLASLFRRGREFGIDTGEINADMKGVRQRKRGMVDGLIRRRQSVSPLRYGQGVPDTVINANLPRLSLPRQGCLPRTGHKRETCGRNAQPARYQQPEPAAMEVAGAAVQREVPSAHIAQRRQAPAPRLHKSLHAQRVSEESCRGGPLLQHLADSAPLCSGLARREKDLLAAARDA
jgi:hypothetical protein